MRTVCVTMALIVGAVPMAFAQTSSRFEVASVARVDRVSVGGSEGGSIHSVMPVFGVVVTARLWKTWGIEGEITQAQGHEFGSFRDAALVSFAATGATREEINRLSVLYRISDGYIPRMGWSVAATARRGLTGRADVELRLGLATRRYVETFDYTVLRIPDGIDPSRLPRFTRGPTAPTGAGASNGRFNTVRGGLLMGVDVPIRITKGLTVTSNVRYVYGLGSKKDDSHREASLGMRIGWRF
jgi:hypothetical protein